MKQQARAQMTLFYAEAEGEAGVRAALGMAAAVMSEPLARREDIETSHAAAARAVEFAGEHERLIVGWLRAHPNGGTKDEIAVGTELSAIAVARRMKGLRDNAGVYDSGETRATPSGRQAAVWKIR